MQRALLSPRVWGLGLMREVQQATLLHNVREQRQLGLIGTENFPYQYEAQ